MLKIGVIGVGVIGKSLYRASVRAGFVTIGFDPYIAEFGPLHDAVLDCDIVFVSVPTLTNNGVQETGPLEEVCEKLKELGYEGVVCIRCTVLPGVCLGLAYTYDLRIVHMPEFLTEANAEQDFLAQNKLWLSGASTDRIIVSEAMYGMIPQKPGVTWVCKMSDDFRVTEVQKYMANCLKALKVAACNEIYSACQKSGIEYDKVREFAVEVLGVGVNHTAVPGPDGMLGYGGLCFPKDMSAFQGWLESLNQPEGVFSAAIKGNEVVRKL